MRHSDIALHGTLLSAPAPPALIAPALCPDVAMTRALEQNNVTTLARMRRRGPEGPEVAHAA